MFVTEANHFSHRRKILFPIDNDAAQIIQFCIWSYRFNRKTNNLCHLAQTVKICLVSKLKIFIKCIHSAASLLRTQGSDIFHQIIKLHIQTAVKDSRIGFYNTCIFIQRIIRNDLQFYIMTHII